LNASSDTRDPKFNFGLTKAKLKEATRKLQKISSGLSSNIPTNKKANQKHKEFLSAVVEDINLVVDRLNLIDMG